MSVHVFGGTWELELKEHPLVLNFACRSHIELKFMWYT